MRLAPPPLPASAAGGDDGRVVDRCYYSDASFVLLLPLAVAYTALSNLSLRLYESSLSLLLLAAGGGGGGGGTCERRQNRRRRPTPLLGHDFIVPLMPQASSPVFRPVAIVTGSNTGIGYETSLELVRRGYNVVLACRSRHKGEEAARSINERAGAGSDAGKREEGLGVGDGDVAAAPGEEVPGAAAGGMAPGPGRAAFVHPCDLSSLDSVRSFVDVLRQRRQQRKQRQQGKSGGGADDGTYSSTTTGEDGDFCYGGVLHLLVNNAGINTNGVSSDGLDLCFQSNFLGHYLLTRLLLPDLQRARHSVRRRRGRTATAVGSGGGTAVDGDGCEGEREEEAGRIVNLSSVMHHFASPNLIPTTADGWVRRCIEVDGWGHPRGGGTYADSKLAAILFAMELNRRCGGNGGGHGGGGTTKATGEKGGGDLTRPSTPNVRAVAVNPGAVNSDIWRAIPEPLLTYIVGPVFRLLYLCPRRGSTTSVAAAVGDLPDGALYLQPYWLPEVGNGLRRKCVGQSGQPSSSPPSVGTWYRCPSPAFEMLGPYVGHAVTEPRLPSPPAAAAAAAALWDACEGVVCCESKGGAVALPFVSPPRAVATSGGAKKIGKVM